MKKHLERMLIKMGDKAAKQGVNSASPGFCFQPKEPEAARKKFLKYSK